MTYQSAVNDFNSTDKIVSIISELSFTNAYEFISSYHRFHWPPGLPFLKKQLVYIDIYPPVTCIIMRLSTVWRDYQLIVEWSQKIFYEIRAPWKIYNRIVHGTLDIWNSRIQLIFFKLKIWAFYKRFQTIMNQVSGHFRKNNEIEFLVCIFYSIMYCYSDSLQYGK